MARVAIRPSPAVADFLRARRKRLGWTLRDVDRRASQAGSPIPFTTLGKIESGAVDPGLRRLHALLQLYGLPIQAAGDLLEMESLATGLPEEKSAKQLREIAHKAWQEGKTDLAVATFFAVRRMTSDDPALTKERHESTLSLAVLAGKLGKHHLSRQMLEEVLTESPDASLLVGILIQLALSWNSLGSPESAHAYLDRAERRLTASSHVERGWVLHLRACIEIATNDFGRAEANLQSAIKAFRAARRPYDEAMCLTTLARLYVEMSDAKSAAFAARRAIAIASKNGYARIRLLASVEQARAQLTAKTYEPALVILRSVLADAVTSSDNVARFYAHFYLWKAYLGVGAAVQAIHERDNAGYYLQFIDEASQEAKELRGLLQLK